MRQALIGHTGFVGSNLLSQQKFDATFNSSNIADIRGQTFDRIICAGVTAVKWWANQNPEEDRSRIANLISHLRTTATGQFTLISTVDIYDNTSAASEDISPDLERLQPYGRNRLELEQFVAEKFSKHTIVRLPGLFGPGLKKNIIYDLLANNRLDLVGLDTAFQWYPMERLSNDIQTAEDATLRIVNFAIEPLYTREIVEAFFPERLAQCTGSARMIYDMHTNYAHVFGSTGNYILSRAGVLERLADFVQKI